MPKQTVLRWHATCDYCGDSASYGGDDLFISENDLDITLKEHKWATDLDGNLLCRYCYEDAHE